MLNIPSYNIGAFSIPYLSGFMGPEAIIVASLFDIGNSLATAGTGYAWAMSVVRGGKERLGAYLQKMLTSPVFDTYLFLLAMQGLGWRLPAPVITFTSTVGSANTFLAMLMIGIGLELRLEAGRYLAAVKYLAVRYSISLLISLLVWFALPLPLEVEIVLTMVLFAPIAAMSAAFTAEAGADIELSTFMTSVTILMAIVLMPSIHTVLA